MRVEGDPKARLELDEALLAPVPGRVASADTLQQLRESEMAAFEAARRGV